MTDYRSPHYLSPCVCDPHQPDFEPTKSQAWISAGTTKGLLSQRGEAEECECRWRPAQKVLAGVRDCLWVGHSCPGGGNPSCPAALTLTAHCLPLGRASLANPCQCLSSFPGKDFCLVSNTASQISHPGQPSWEGQALPAHQSCAPIWLSRLLLGVSILDLLRALATVTVTTRSSTRLFTCQGQSWHTGTPC